MNIFAKVAIRFTVPAVFFFCATAAVAQTEVSISSWVPPSHLLVKDFLVPWTQEVEKATNGRVKFRFLPKMVANPIGHLDAVKDGLADLAFISHSYTPARFPLTMFGVMPFAGRDAEARSVAVWRTYDKYLAKADEHQGVKLLTIYTHGPGMVFNSKHPITKIEDFAGLKIRVGGGMAMDVGQAVGATVLQKPAPESYELLSQGVVDGVFFPAESMVSFKLDKIIRYATEFPGGLYADTHAVIMNEAKFNSLSKQDQAILMKLAGEHMSRIAGKAWDKNDREAYAVMKASNIQITTADAAFVNAIRERTRGFEAEWLKHAAAKGIDGPKVLASFREELKKAEASK